MITQLKPNALPGRPGAGFVAIIDTVITQLKANALPGRPGLTFTGKVTSTGEEDPNPFDALSWILYRRRRNPLA